MKRISLGLMLIMVVLLAAAPSITAYAQDESSITDDQVNELASDLYCPVCENVPLEVCPTVACAQWRDLIREKMELGWSEQQIREFFAEQYGDQVLSVPPMRGFNWLIYVLPPLVIVIGIIVVVNIITRSRKIAALSGDATKPAGRSVEDNTISEIEQDLRRME